MDCSEKALSDFFGILRSWIPKRSEPENLSRDFWMPDHSCRVCYECDSQFTVFNRRHHCRLCGRVFCAKCTLNSVPISSDDPKNAQESGGRVRVCNFCFKQWERDKVTADNRNQASSLSASPSLSFTSFASTKSSVTVYSSFRTGCSSSQSTGHYPHVPLNSGLTPGQSVQLEPCGNKLDILAAEKDADSSLEASDPPPNLYGLNSNRNDDEKHVGDYTETQSFQHSDDYYLEAEFNSVDQSYHFTEECPTEEINSAMGNFSPFHDTKDYYASLGVHKMTENTGVDSAYNHEVPSSVYGMVDLDAESQDLESNGLLWVPPGPEDEEDDREDNLFDDDEEDAPGQWGYFCNSNYGSGERHTRERTDEGHQNVMKNVVGGHFRTLITQLLQAENLPIGEEDNEESWLEIITSLSWEAATFLKPDTSKGGGMDPGGYVKVKCIACGTRNESTVIKGVVCKKKMANRRMASKIENPRVLILGGALEYERVSHLLSSFDTLLQQEMDYLKMAVAKIDAQHPDVLLVEKSVSHFARDYILEKNISLVLNIKRTVLERIARCTGSQIVPSIDYLSPQNLGSCELFYVEKCFEEHGTAELGGKKMTKNLIFFEGCPKPLGCTVLLKGANGDELKRIKHVMQYGIFAAYHLAMETSFLADEGASLPELSSTSPITVALLDKPSSINRSISTVPGFVVSSAGGPQLSMDSQGLNMSVPTVTSDPENVNGTDSQSSAILHPQTREFSSTFMNQSVDMKVFSKDNGDHESAFDSESKTAVPSSTSRTISDSSPQSTLYDASKPMNEVGFVGHNELKLSEGRASNDNVIGPINCPDNLCTFSKDSIVANDAQYMAGQMTRDQSDSTDIGASHQNYNEKNEFRLSKEFASPSDHQSILVSLLTRCVWKGTVCQCPHLFRIKYYGSFDKPLGRFLRDLLFDQSYRCRSCDMPSEAHVHCYTHRQGSLTISVRKLAGLLLAGEEDGKIWMWHRCLLCPRINGLPPATQRVVMSDAAWGLSFGKFLELTFSNHVAASRVASCGHSVHKDCLRFYGFGNTVACFRYASINVHSVYLPPPMLKFNYQVQEWVQKEANEVAEWAKLLFSDVLKALSQIVGKNLNAGPLDNNLGVLKSSRQIVELEQLLQKETMEFEESMRKLLKEELKEGQPALDILVVNKLRRQLLFQSYLWDQRLTYASNSPCEVPCGLLTTDKEKLCSTDLADFNVSPQGGSTNADANSNEFFNGSVHLVECQEGLHNRPSIPKIDQQGENELSSLKGKQNKNNLMTIASGIDQLDPLEPDLVVRRTLSDGHFPISANLSDALDAKWTGESALPPVNALILEPSVPVEDGALVSVYEDSEEKNRSHLTQPLVSALPTKWGDSAEDFLSWIGTPFLNIYRSLNKNWDTAPRFDALSEYKPNYVSFFREIEHQNGGRLLLPVGVNDTVIPIHDDEPTSIISYALVSTGYHFQMLEEQERIRDGGDLSLPTHLYDPLSFHQFHSVDDSCSEHLISVGANDDDTSSLSGSRNSQISDPPNQTEKGHVRVSFAHKGAIGKLKYTVTCYFARRFDALRRACCPSELDFVRSLSRCKKWGAQGGKSNVFFAKSLDERFIIKQVTKTELESFIKFGPEYFKYLSESIDTKSPTCLAKILGIYQVTSKHLKSGKESRMDLLVMENLLFERKVMRLYDLKGSSRSRYNPDSSGENRVLLDQNLIEAMPTSPIFVGNKAKRLLERAVWNDTSFLASIGVMDYSLLVGVDEENHELVIGIIDFMRKYTWDKHLETWVKTSGILGGPKNALPTVISPKQYKKRFRKAMSTYFIMVPDQWSPPSPMLDNSEPRPSEDDLQDAAVSLRP